MALIFKNSILCLFLSIMAFPVFAQELTGDWTMIGRRCENNTDNLIPPGDGSVMEMVFNHQNRTFSNIFRYTIEQPQGPSEEEIRDRHLGYFEEEKQSHEDLCRTEGEGVIVASDGFTDLCTPQNKQELFNNMRASRERDAQREFEEAKTLHNQFLSEYSSSFGECRLTLTGNYSLPGGRVLNLFVNDFTATQACGDASYPPRVNTTYYFDSGNLYIVQPANENSRPYCGSLDWAEIYSPR